MTDLITAPDTPLVNQALKTPRAAAIAGILFSVLLTASLWLLRISIPSDTTEIGLWLQTNSGRVIFALNLIPLAGVAFMWFLGVLRDRLGPMEDQLFATVFLGSGLLFLGMLFVAASAIGGLVLAYEAASDTLINSPALAFARGLAHNLTHIYAFKMASVFMMITSTLALRVGFAPRWIAVTGFASALFLLIGSSFFDWAVFVFPAWVFIVSIYVLITNYREDTAAPSRRLAG